MNGWIDAWKGKASVFRFLLSSSSVVLFSFFVFLSFLLSSFVLSFSSFLAFLITVDGTKSPHDVEQHLVPFLFFKSNRVNVGVGNGHALEIHNCVVGMNAFTVEEIVQGHVTDGLMIAFLVMIAKFVCTSQFYARVETDCKKVPPTPCEANNGGR
jgi:hypothetical protein